MASAFRWIRAVQNLHQGSAPGKGTLGDGAHEGRRAGCASADGEEGEESQGPVGQTALVSTPAYFCARIILTPLITFFFLPTVDDSQGSRLRLSLSQCGSSHLH